MKNKIFIFAAAVLIFAFPLFTQNKKDTDYISEETVASVVKLSSVLKVYTVDGLSDNYHYKSINGEPDFGNAKVLSTEEVFVDVGTGVIVTAKGLILTNAHVFGAYAEPEIYVKKNPAGNVMTGKSGQPIKQVLVNQYPAHMFVGVCEVENLKNNNDYQKLAYIAEKIIWDHDYKDYYRDRAVLQIVNKCELGDSGLPVIGEKCLNAINIPFAKLANPFEHGYLDTRVRAVGFPGVGDPNRASKTSGELLGYEDDNHSNILHTSWISNGNSGGGLFYKDNLIGINTWDNHSNASRPVAIAQPNTYWNEFFAYTKYIFPSVELPDFSYDWVDTDPGKEKYKNEVFVSLQLVHKENDEKVCRRGRLAVFNESFTRDSLEKYIQYSKDFETSWKIIKMLWEKNIDEVLEEVEIDKAFAYDLKNVTCDSDLRALLTPEYVPYYDLWCGSDFTYDIYTINISGKTVISVPKNSNIKMIYLDEDDNESAIYTLKVNDNKEQGPFIIKIGK